MRRAARRDENEPQIVAALEGAGFTVERLSAAGICDLLIGRHGKTWLLEVIGDAKAAKYRKSDGLTPAQVEFRSRWRGQWASARNVTEALAAVGVTAT